MTELNKLRWRCRRGTRELDLLLSRYLESSYGSACQAEQQAFLSLLDLEDVQLSAYLLAESVPANHALEAVVLAIRLVP